MSRRGIFFDAAGVLYYRREHTEDTLACLLQERGLATELSADDRVQQQAWRSLANTGQLDPAAYWDRVLGLHGVAVAEEREFLAGQIMDQSDRVLPMPGAREALDALKGRGLLLGIVTDTMYPLARKMRWLERVGVAEFIDVVACSTDLGVQKPDPAIYLHALQRAHLSPDESVFVGHDADEIDGAHRAGMATVAVNHSPGTRADHYAESLLDLLNVPILAHSVPASCEQNHKAKAEHMNPDIEAIFIDVGNTLRVLVEDEPYQTVAREQITTLVGADECPDAFCQRLDQRYKVYRKWAFETMLEASEKELWTRWMLPDWPPERIGPLAGELTFLYRQTMGHRFAQPDTKEVVVELTRRGYQLGILSNTITEREIPRWLEEDGLSQYFSTVVLSSIFGRRKPGPDIYWEAARRAGVEPRQAAYVADNPTRDVPGSRRAGFGMIIIMGTPEQLAEKDLTGENKPDLVVHSLSELLGIFPPRLAARGN